MEAARARADRRLYPHRAANAARSIFRPQGARALCREQGPPRRGRALARRVRDGSGAIAQIGAPEPTTAPALNPSKLHRSPEPDRVEHGCRREIPVGQLPDETSPYNVDQGGVHAPVGGFRIDEIAFLQREPAEILARHGARFVETADEEVGQRLLRLPLRLRLRLCLDVLMQNLRLRLRLLMQNLRLRLRLILEVMMRLMDCFAHLLVRLRPLA